MTDSSGGFIPALMTDEAGVAISQVWVKKRAWFTHGLMITPRLLRTAWQVSNPSACDAQVTPTTDGVAAAAGNAAKAAKACDRVVADLRGYVGLAGGRGFAESYFGLTRFDIDETLAYRRRNGLELDAYNVQPQVGAGAGHRPRNL